MSLPQTYYKATQLFAKSAIHPTQILSTCRKNIESYKWLNAIVCDYKESSQRAAVESEYRWMNGRQLSLIDGMPIAIKDNFCTKEGTTTDSSKTLHTFTAPYDSTVTRLLYDAGAVFVGKTNMDEFAMGSATSFTYNGQCYNPWGSLKNPLVPGGSSGGSAASVASGMCYAALGSDTGGSIRQPGSFCGIVGFKPTYGSLSRYGVISLASSLDTPGVLTREPIDAALVYDVLNHPDNMDSITASEEEREQVRQVHHINNISTFEKCLQTKDLKGITIGIPREFITEELKGCVHENWQIGMDMCREMGATLVEVSIPHVRYSLPIYSIVCGTEAASNLAKFDGIRYGYREDKKDIKDLKDFIRNNRSEGFGSEVQKRVLVGTYAVSKNGYSDYYIPACEMRNIIRREVNQVFDNGVDLLLTPTTPMDAFSPETKMSSVQMYMADVMTVPASITGIPAISFPIRMFNNRPQSLQFMGRQFNDGLVLAAANLLQTTSQYKLPEHLPLSS
ncbi:hypothetical protein WA158_006490 [Blastocystis sp. Blastoise]